MEKREIIKIRRKIKRRKSSSSLSLPLDLAMEICLRLPAKSVLRFRGVSKLWSSIATNPYFTNTFKPKPNLLFFFKKDDKFFVFTVPQHNLNPNESCSYSSSDTIDSYQITCPKDCCHTIRTESIHGLICFHQTPNPIFWNFIVWNPSTRNFFPLFLRKPEKSWRSIVVSLGYDPIECKHKVVCMSCEVASDKCCVLTLGSSGQESWRTVKTSYTYICYRTTSYGVSRCINGVLYHIAFINSGRVRVFMSFDVRTEKFDVIKLPIWKNNFVIQMTVSYKEKLAFLVGYNGNDDICSMWVLEDAEKSEWSSHNVLPLSHYDKRLHKLYKLVGFTNDGELIYVPNSVVESCKVIYIDPVRNTLRRVEYRGIGDEDSRKRKRLGDKPLSRLQFFPNHTETLMSL